MGSKSIQGTERYRRNPDLIGAAIDDEMVMMSVEHGQYYGLGGVAPRVWELIEKPCTLDGLVNAIVKEYEVDQETCRNDLVGFLAQMESLGLVQRD